MRTFFTKMLLGLLLSLWASPCFTSSLPDNYSLEILMDNVVYLHGPYDQYIKIQVPLTCGQSYQDQAVFWKKDGKQLVPALRGNSVSVEVEEMDGGNYTCHSGSDGRYLNHTLILVKPVSDSDPKKDKRVILKEWSTGEHIRCSAANYKGAFHCEWKRTTSRSNAAIVQVKAQRDTIIPCTLSANGSSVRCQDTRCPHNEEQHPISITVHIRNYARLEEYTKGFFLRDIVSPEKLQNLHLSDDSVFSWNLPETWEQPCSFYSLEFQVKVVHEDQECTNAEYILESIIDERQYKVDVTTKSYRFCVRARDKYTRGPWCGWIQHKVSEN